MNALLARPGIQEFAAIDEAEAPTVFVVDSDALAREAFGFVIRSAGWHVESFASAEEFLARPRAVRAACLLTDVALPRLNGLALQQSIADRPEMPVIFVTDRHDIGTTVCAMKAGAVDFLTKPASSAALIGAIRCALERSRRALSLEASLRAIRNRFELLTPREREVMAHVVSGRLNKQIAAQLGNSEITVKIHRGNLMRKMQAESLPALVHMAAQLGMSVGAGRSMARAGQAFTPTRS